MIKTPTDQGLNLTGIGTSPIDGKALAEGPQIWPPSSPGSDQRLFDVRAEYTSEAEPISTMPPSTTQGAVAKKLKGEKVTVFLDKLGERLAFERTGARLYQALICKAKLLEGKLEKPSVKELERIYQDELRHFHLLKEALEALGADPTVMAPSAEISSVSSMGLIQVLCDPRTTVSECLCAILTTELTDNDGWELLIQLAHQMEQPELAKIFTQALQEEQKHLASVRSWLCGAASIESGVQAPTRMPRPQTSSPTSRSAK
jgi:rubrerythrin